MRRYPIRSNQPHYVTDRAAFIQQFLIDLERPYRSFLTTQLDNIVMANEAKTRAPCFQVGSTIYARNGVHAQVGKLRGLGGTAELEPELQDVFEEYLAHHEEHTMGYIRFAQSLRVLLSRANSWQELRDMLPERVIQPYLNGWGFSGLQRSCPPLGEESYASSPWGEGLEAQFMEIKDKLDLYVGYRLL